MKSNINIVNEANDSLLKRGESYRKKAQGGQPNKNMNVNF